MDDSLNSQSIQKYIESLLKRSVPSSIIQRKLNALKKFFSWAREQNKIDEKEFSELSSVLQKELDQISARQPHGLIPGLDKVFYQTREWLNGILGKLPFRKSKNVILVSEAHPESRKTDSGQARMTRRRGRMTVDLGVQHYIGIALVLVLMATLGAGAFNQFFNKARTPFAFPSQLTKPSQRYVSFQGRVTDSLGNPIVTATNFQFKLYNVKTAGTSLYATGTCSLTPDQDGILNVLVGGSGLTTDQNVCGTGITENIFSDFPNVYLGITIGSDSEATPRQQIANVGYAVNAETLQGFPPGTGKSTIPYLDLNGDVLIATSGASVKSLWQSANFTIASSNNLILQSAGPAAGAGDIILQATGSGALRFRTAGSTDTETRMIILNGGNVGIGTPSPTSKLHVLGTSDEVQITVQASPTQVANVFEARNATGVQTMYLNEKGELRATPAAANSVPFRVKQFSSAQSADITDWTDAAGNNLTWIDESANLRIGSSAPDTGKLNVTGAYTGKALAIFDETGDQAPLTASASGSPVFTVAHNGDITATSTETTGNAFSFTASSLTSGNLIAITPGTGLVSGGNIINIVSPTVTLASGTVNLLNFPFTDASAAGTSSFVNGVRVAPSISSSGAGATKRTVGFLVDPGATQTCSAGTCTLAAFRLASSSITQAASATFNIYGADLVMPNITQTTGTIATNGVNLTTGSITTGGTANAINIAATGVGAGTLTGVNISGITASGGTETAIAIGSGWDNAININSGALTLNSNAIDSTGALNLGITNATSVVIGRTGQTVQIKSPATIAANGVVYLSDTSGTVAETAASTGAQCLTTAGAGTAPVWGSCSGAATVALSSITAATTTNTIANANFAQAWNWGTLTTETGMTFGGGTAMTTGSILALGGATYVHTTAETGNLSSITFTDSSTNTTGNSITNGLNIASTINTSGAGTKSINAINIATPTKTACTTGACTWTGLAVADPGTLANATFYAATFAGGNVGIGTTTPSTSLEILGDSNTAGILSIRNTTTTGASDILLTLRHMTTGTAVSGIGARLVFQNENDAGTVKDSAYIDGTLSTVTNNSEVGDLRFLIRSSGSVSERVRITGAGNVGIGNTSPVGKLDVSGAITGKALAIFDETGDQALLTASASGVTKFTVDHTGTITTTSVGTAGLKTAQGSTSFCAAANVDFTMQDYTFFPNLKIGSCTGLSIVVKVNQSDTSTSTTDSTAKMRITIGTVGTGTALAVWRYVTASDHPTIWVVAKDDGSIVRVWQAEDPIHQFEYPANSNPFGNDPLPQGQYYVSPQPMTVDQLQSFFQSLPSSDQQEIMTLTKEYIVDKRQWLSSFSSLSDIHSISERYQPTARFWVMRFIAQYYGLDPAELIENLMVVSNGQLAPKPNFYNTLQTYLAWRTKVITENRAKQAQLDKDQADLAEFYPASSILQPGDIVEAVPHIDPEEGEAGKNKILLVKTVSENSPKLLGVISTSPSQVLNENASGNQVPLALSGRVPVKVTNIGGEITVGDPITSSSLPGVGTVSTKPGEIVGKALETFSCQSFSDCQDIGKVKYWVDENGNKVDNPQSASGKIYPVSTITMFVNTSWFEPDVHLASIADLQLVENSLGGIKWQLINVTGELVKKIGAFSELASAYIKAGSIRVNELVATNIISTDKIVSPIIETTDINASGEAQLNQISTNVIKPQDKDLTVILGSEATPGSGDSGQARMTNSDSGPLAKIIIKGLNGKIVSTFDAAGNASFSGTLAAKEATISGTIAAGKVETKEASITGKLTAKEIESDTINQLKDRLTLAAADSGQAKTTSQELSTSVNNIQSLLADIRKQPLSDPQYYQNLDNNPVVSSLTVSGDTTLYNATIANSLTAGTISIENNQLISLTTELKLSALSSVNILDGAVVIARDGTMTTKGTIIAKGGIEVQNSDLRFKNKEGVETASIDASGSAKFKSLSLDKYLDATSSAIIATPEENFNKNGLFASAIETQKQTAGVGIVPVDSNEIVIYNQTVKDASLIYLTPTTQTSTQLTVTQKQICGPQSPSNCKPYFKVLSSQPIHPEIGFNWLIIN